MCVKYVNANVFAEHTVTVSAHGTKIVALPELLATTATEGGIRVTYNGIQNSLAINGAVEDPAVGYSAILPFVPAQISTPTSTATPVTTIAELGLMVGAADPMMSFPAGTKFTPYSVLRNVSAAPATLSPTLWWMEAGAPRSAQIPQLTLAPFATQGLDVMSLLSAAGLSNFNGSVNLVFSTQVQPGTLVLASGSVDQTNTYVFEVIPRGVVESTSKSLAYWSIGNGDDTMVTMWNPADEAQDFVFKLFFTGGYYLYPIHLGPRASLTFNVSEIVHNQVPDSEGNIIPATVKEGSAKISGAKAENEAILVSLDAGIYNVRKATCGQVCFSCDGYTDFGLNVSPFTIAAGTTQDLEFLINYADGFQYNDTAFSTWTSSDTSVATVQEFPTNDYTVVTGTGPGNVTITVEDGNPNPPYIPYQCFPTGMNCPISEDYLGGYSQGTVTADPTPVVNSVNSNVWNAGTVISVTVSGTGFGTAPTLSFSDTSITVNSYTSRGDTQIVASITIPASAPNETVTVTVTSTGYNGNGFIGGSGQSSQGSNTATVSAIQATPPAILLNGQNVTGTTQNVVVGQQIALTGSFNLPSGVGIASESWSGPDPAGTVGGYNASVSSGQEVAMPSQTCSTNSSTCNFTYYYLVAEGADSVTFSYALTNGTSPASSTVRFSVAAPTPGSGGFMSTTNSSVGVTGPPSLGLGVFKADGTIATAGINFFVNATPPSGDQGTFLWVQLVDSDKVQLLTNLGPQLCTAPVSLPALDNFYPYPTPTVSGNTNDSPGLTLSFNSVTGEAQRVFSATMYLMWDPTLNLDHSTCTAANTNFNLQSTPSYCTGSIPVPLASVTWNWAGCAVDTLNPTVGVQGWTAQSGYGCTSQNIPQPQSNPLYPTWSADYLNRSMTCSIGTTEANPARSAHLRRSILR